jgi:2-keto-4-pentenoate hydratase/2-oxohepta-3-ene-1,7-dioic acid hydratase in catechol pathway
LRLASFELAGRAVYGVVAGADVIDLTALPSWPYPDLRSLLGAWSPRLRDEIGAVTGPRIGCSEVRFRPVIPNPDKIVCVGLNYRDHVAETERAVPPHPVLFLRLPNSQVGHRQPLIRPLVSQQLDFEGELAVIIGATGRHIPARAAGRHVAGFAIYNEASVRDWQHHTHQFTAGKNFLGTGAFGPWMVTADEIPDPQKLRLVTRLNGEVMQQASLADLIFPIEELIAYISTFTELAPGDVIATGTPAGVGGLRKPPVWLRPGDTIEVEISDIGILSNPVEGETARQ